MNEERRFNICVFVSKEFHCAYSARSPTKAGLPGLELTVPSSLNISPPTLSFTASVGCRSKEPVTLVATPPEKTVTVFPSADICTKARCQLLSFVETLLLTVRECV